MKLSLLLPVLAVPFSLALVACSSSTPSSPFSASAGASGSTASGGGISTSGGTSSGGSPIAGSGGSPAAGSGGSPAAGTAGGGAAAGGAGAAGAPGNGMADPTANFFVSSDKSATGNLHGITGADQRCQRLAAAVGLGQKTWHAYLSTESPAANARDRIGEGPYINVKGALLAATKTALHARSGDPMLFITEQGNTVNGQWNAPVPPATDPTWANEHDILTGSNIDGSLFPGSTCGDWTAITGSSRVGHSDGMGPAKSTAEPYPHWSSVHAGQCGNTTPGGGAGRIYCFVAP